MEKGNKIFKFGIFWVLLPYYGYLDEWWKVMTTAWRKTRMIWIRSRTAFETVMRGRLREMKEKELEELRMRLALERKFDEKMYGYMIRNYSFKYRDGAQRRELMKIVGMLEKGQVLMMYRAFPYHSVSQEGKYTVKIWSEEEFEELHSFI